MATAIKPLEQLRTAYEATRNTPITTMTRIQYFREASHIQDVGTIIPQEGWASFFPNRRAYAGLQRNSFEISGDWTYTDGPWWANTALGLDIAGSVTDTSAYTWTHTPHATSDDLKSFTAEYSTKDLIGTVGWRVGGCIVNELSITWRKRVGGGETGVSFNAKVMTPLGATQITAFTGSLSDRTIVNALGTNTKMYLNATGSAHGTTQDSKIIETTFSMNNGYEYKDVLDGTALATAIIKTKPRTSKVTMQRWFDDKTELDIYLSKATRRVQVLTEGDVVGGTTAKNTVKLNYTGVYAGHKQAYVDGMWGANLELEPMYDSGLSADWQLIMINADSSTLD